MTPAPLQVCFVIQKLHGLSGGAERVVLQTATAMAARGMQVRIVIYDTASGPPKFDTGGLEIRNLLPSVLQSRAGAAPQGGQTPAALRKFPQSGVMGHLKWAVTHGLFARRLRAEPRRAHRRRDRRHRAYRSSPRPIMYQSRISARPARAGTRTPSTAAVPARP